MFTFQLFLVHVACNLTSINPVHTLTYNIFSRERHLVKLKEEELRRRDEEERQRRDDEVRVAEERRAAQQAAAEAKALAKAQEEATVSIK